ncbi:nucleotide exchange factor SIL1 isoform X2 [Nematostella vectensis]|uniref:nucleotide exchange factor SIL1 isoform X2 n=1 Tax=Nematostella vectensis TaxID=45351 RepID=UPI00138FBC89|nr:nucleotide exchange factor SIL1 isoform X2 [Nematostella vectensis]
MKVLTFVAFLGLLVFGLGHDRDNPGSIIAVPSDHDNVNNKETPTDTVTQSFLEETKSSEVFEPTSEWQTIKPGQAIPAGLHVQMNLQTGEKQAKLMDGDDGSKYKKHAKAKYYKEYNQKKEKVVKIDRNVFTKQHLKDALRDFKDKFHDDTTTGSGSEQIQTSRHFRPIEDIRKELEGSDIFMKKDIDVIKEHVQVLNSSESTMEQLEHALDELEYFVHQIDNAKDFDTIGGLAIVIKLMNSTESGLSSRAAYVLGSAVQSNPSTQKSAQSKGALLLLLRLLAPSQPMAVRRKAMYGLSSLIRLYSKGQQEFLKLNGLETFIKLFSEDKAGPLRVKALTLMTDILTEQFDYIKGKAKMQGVEELESVVKQVPLLQAMVAQGLCAHVSALLDTTDNDTREKVLQALDIMMVGCKHELKHTSVFKSLQRLRDEWTNSAASSQDSDERDYLMSLSQLALELISKLNRI